VDAITAAVLAWLLDAIQVIGPLVTIAIVVWARKIIAKLSTGMAVADAELQPGLDGAAKLEAAVKAVEALPRLVRPRRSDTIRHIEGHVAARKRASVVPPEPAVDVVDP